MSEGTRPVGEKVERSTRTDLGTVGWLVILVVAMVGVVFVVLPAAGIRGDIVLALMSIAVWAVPLVLVIWVLVRIARTAEELLALARDQASRREERS